MEVVMKETVGTATVGSVIAKSGQGANGGQIVEETHPLLESSQDVFRSSEEWLTAWDEATFLAERLGLLHSLTTENGWWQNSELVSLLLKIADGYGTEDSFITQSEREFRNLCSYTSAMKNRQVIAEKAFLVLCLRFFGYDNKKSERPLWWWMLEDEVLFQRVLWFFRQEKLGKARNCEILDWESPGTNHQKQIMKKFLRDFAHLGWEAHSFSFAFTAEDEKINKPIWDRLTASRPNFINILYELRELDWLNVQELDIESLKKLAEIAMSNYYSFPPTIFGRGTSYRKPDSVEEAMFGGSVPAQIVLLYRIREKIRRRLNDQYEESRHQQEIRDRQQKLNDLEKQRRELERQEKNINASS